MNKTSVLIGRVVLAAGLAVVAATVQPAAAQVKGKVPPAPAQVHGKWLGTAFFSIDGGGQVTSSPYTSRTTFPLNAEDARLDVETPGAPGAAFMARGGVRLWRRLAVGAAVTAFWSTCDVDVTASLPHPFFFNQPRSISGSASGLQHDETMVAVEVSWMVPLSRRLDLNVFAGPAFFTIRQDMVTNVRFTETYPYDTATFVGIDSVSVSDSATGFTAGADVSYLFSKSIGVGGQLRYSYATTSLSPSGGQSTSVDLGGLQVGGGLRIRF